MANRKYTIRRVSFSTLNPGWVCCLFNGCCKCQAGWNTVVHVWWGSSNCLRLGTHDATRDARCVACVSGACIRCGCTISRTLCSMCMCLGILWYVFQYVWHMLYHVWYVMCQVSYGMVWLKHKHVQRTRNHVVWCSMYVYVMPCGVMSQLILCYGMILPYMEPNGILWRGVAWRGAARGSAAYVTRRTFISVARP